MLPFKRQHNRLTEGRCHVSAISGLFGGGGGDAAEEAGQVQAVATEEAARIGEQRFGETRQSLLPFQQAAIPALNQFQALLGLGGGTGAGGFAGAATGQTEEQLRQQLLQSGRFGREAGPVGREEFEFRTRFGVKPPQTLDEALAIWNQRGLASDVFVNPQALLAAGQEITTGVEGGIDQAALDAEVQRQLAQQARPQAGGQTAQEAQQAAFESLVESPGQRFIRDRAAQGVTRQASALGGLGGGRVRTALTQQAAGFAQQDLQNRFSRLQALIGGGQNAATNLGSLGQQQAATAGGLVQQGAQARASGILGAQQAEAQQGEALAGLAGAALAFFSDERLKEDIHDLDLKSCFEAVTEIPLKSWRYLEAVGLDTNIHIGPMAAEAPEMIKGGEIEGYEVLSLHDELMMLAGAIQYMKNEGMLKCH